MEDRSEWESVCIGDTVAQSVRRIGEVAAEHGRDEEESVKAVKEEYLSVSTRPGKT